MANARTNRITLKSPNGTEYDAYPSRSSLNACCACGEAIAPGQPFVTCADCGGLFCRSCVEDGTFDGHECEPDDAGD